MECPDFSEFQDTLKNMRKVDDIIVNTINSVLPTNSFHPNGEASCKDLYQQLDDGNKKREKTIKDCILVATERVKNLKEEREKNIDNKDVSKALRAEQTKLRMLQVELTVEDLIQQRTMKVFVEKCRRYFKPPE